VRAAIGERIEPPYAVHLERLKCTLRDRLDCITRKTYAFTKDSALWDALFSLAIFEHNWIRPLIALRLRLPQPVHRRRYDRHSPAMGLDLADHVWSWAEVL
jgi:hypothetical protein